MADTKLWTCPIGFCARCDKHFRYRGIFMDEDCVDMHFSKCRAQCPRCHKMGVLLDGVYNYGIFTPFLKRVEDAILKLPDPLAAAIEAKQAIEAALNKPSPQKFDDAIARFPWLQWLAELRPKTRDEARNDLKFLLQIILTVIALIKGCAPDARDEQPEMPPPAAVSPHTPPPVLPQSQPPTHHVV